MESPKVSSSQCTNSVERAAANDAQPSKDTNSIECAAADDVQPGDISTSSIVPPNNSDHRPSSSVNGEGGIRRKIHVTPYSGPAPAKASSRPKLEKRFPRPPPRERKRESEGEVFLLNLWYWHHLWQKKEVPVLIDIITRVLKDEQKVVSSDDVLRITDCWTFVSRHNIRDHLKLVDEGYFPELKPFLTDHTRLLDSFMKDHAKIISLMKKIDDKADVMRQESGGVTLSSIAEWKNSVVEVMTAYLAQIEEEEKELIPLITKTVEGYDQRDINDKIKELQKQIPSSKFSTLATRDIVNAIPEEKDKFEKYYPYFMRRVSLALWEKSDPLYRAHATLFGGYQKEN